MEWKNNTELWQLATTGATGMQIVRAKITSIDAVFCRGNKSSFRSLARFCRRNHIKNLTLWLTAREKIWARLVGKSIVSAATTVHVESNPTQYTDNIDATVTSTYVIIVQQTAKERPWISFSSWSSLVSFLFHPFPSHWWFLQSDWPSEVWFIHESLYLLL